MRKIVSLVNSIILLTCLQSKQDTAFEPRTSIQGIKGIEGMQGKSGPEQLLGSPRDDSSRQVQE